MLAVIRRLRNVALNLADSADQVDHGILDGHRVIDDLGVLRPAPQSAEDFDLLRYLSCLRFIRSGAVLSGVLQVLAVFLAFGAY